MWLSAWPTKVVVCSTRSCAPIQIFLLQFMAPICEFLQPASTCLAPWYPIPSVFWQLCALLYVITFVRRWISSTRIVEYRLPTNSVHQIVESLGGMYVDSICGRIVTDSYYSPRKYDHFASIANFFPRIVKSTDSTGTTVPF